MATSEALLKKDVGKWKRLDYGVAAAALIYLVGCAAASEIMPFIIHNSSYFCSGEIVGIVTLFAIERSVNYQWNNALKKLNNFRSPTHSD